MSSKYLFFFIILLAAFFRFYNINWDQDHHLHPDERAIVMFTTPLEFPKTITEFLSPQSPWNPHFFAYGSFPIYLLKIVGNIVSIIDPAYATYDKINLLGRFLSSMFDIGTLIVLFFLARKFFNKNIGLLAVFFYAISVLPIQLSHFYAVDTPLTFFVLLTLYRLIQFYEHSTLKNAFLVGIFFGLSLATKTSALVLLVSVSMAIAVDFLLIFLKNPHRPHIWFLHLPKFLKRLLINGIVILLVTLTTFIIFEPYALIDFQTFLRQNMEQRQMTYNAFTFPYTLQYVGKIPYVYELKNIFLWGLGPILATFSFLGVLFITFRPVSFHLQGGVAPAVHLGGEIHGKQTIILLSFFWIYFAVVGNFAIGFMRYMLPLYPFLCLFAAVLFEKLLSIIPSKLYAIRYTLYAFALCAIIWPLSFMHIYTQPNTRILASEWIYKNVPPNATIAREHWDDGLPIGGNISYNIQELPIYEMGNPMMQDKIYQTLNNTDYIIIASNRLYIPLQRIALHCQTWHIPQERCPTNANVYYQKLFNGSLGFQKVAEFSMFPQLSILNVQFSIDDSSADESFTVYDHPKVMIFKKI